MSETSETRRVKVFYLKVSFPNTNSLIIAQSSVLPLRPLSIPCHRSPARDLLSPSTASTFEDQLMHVIHESLIGRILRLFSPLLGASHIMQRTLLIVPDANLPALGRNASIRPSYISVPHRDMPFSSLMAWSHGIRFSRVMCCSQRL